MGNKIIPLTIAVALGIAIAGAALDGGELKNVSFKTSTDEISQAASAFVSFETTVDIPADAVFGIYFPLAFGISGVSRVSSEDITGGLRFEADGRELRLKREGGSVMKKGTVIDDLMLFGLITPSTTGWSDPYRVTVYSFAGKEMASGKAKPIEFVNQRKIPQEPLTFSLNSPNGGETFKAGTSVPVVWNRSQHPEFDTVSVWLSVDGGKSYDEIKNGIDIDSSFFTLTLPTTSVSRAKVLVKAFNAFGAIVREDESNANFKIE